MNVSQSNSVRHQRLASQFPPSAFFVLMGISLLLAGCGSFKPKLSMPDLSIPRLTPNSNLFKNRFYAGASFGATSLSPNTTDSPGFTADSNSAGASQIRVGYDLHNRIALEFDSSILGETGFNQTSEASIKYSSLATSALFYAISGNENRNRREKWSGYGRLGVGLNRTASNIKPLDGSKAGFLLGAGVEYGMKNGLGIRGEITRFDSQATFVGVGVVFRFNSVKRFVPDNISLNNPERVKVASRFDNAEDDAISPVGSNEPSLGYANADPRGEIPGDLLSPHPIGAVRVLASASDYDTDGVANDIDRCRDTMAGTVVDKEGCGLFDGILANSTFSSGSAGLGENVKASLDNMVTRLIAFPEVRIAIEGHTDGKGPEDINMNVSRARAHMVRDYLIRQGVPAQQLETHAFGEMQPLADNETEKGRDQNRRIAFVTLPSLSREEISSPQIPVLVAQKKIKKERTKMGVAQSDEPSLAAAQRGIDLLPATMQIPGLDVRKVVENVAFGEKSAQLRPESMGTITEVAKALRRHKHIRVMLAAHTNEFETEEENMTLSTNQAQSMARELVNQGVDRRQLMTRGFGNSLPIVQEVSDANRAKNRRIELRPVRN